MDSMIYILPIVAIAAIVIFVVIKFNGTKNNSQGNQEDVIDPSVNFCITNVWDKAADGTLEVSGVVKNVPIVVGSSFRIVDKNGNIIDTNVVVEKIDLGVVKSKCITEAPVGEFVTLFLRTECAIVEGEAFLKK